MKGKIFLSTVLASLLFTACSTPSQYQATAAKTDTNTTTTDTNSTSGTTSGTTGSTTGGTTSGTTGSTTGGTTSGTTGSTTGTGGTTTSTPTGSAAVQAINGPSISGYAIDGYIKNAVVCIDLNRNNKCDINEPYTISKTDGSWAFAMPTSQTDKDKYLNSFIIVKDGFDVLTKRTFNGVLKTPVYSLTNEIDITPLTTLVTNKINSTTDKNQALTDASKGLGIDEVFFTVDPLKLNSEAILKTNLKLQMAIDMISYYLSSGTYSDSSIEYAYSMINNQLSSNEKSIETIINSLDLSTFDATTTAALSGIKTELGTMYTTIDNKVYTEDTLSANMQNDFQNIRDTYLSQMYNLDLPMNTTTCTSLGGTYDGNMCILKETSTNSESKTKCENIGGIYAKNICNLPTLENSFDSIACQEANGVYINKVCYIKSNQSTTTEGMVCDDGNALTINDKFSNNVCVGTIPAGTACNDGNEFTRNDVYTNNICAGTYIEGAPCDDGSNVTINDVITAEISGSYTCKGALSTYINAPADGALCDDTDATTINDHYMNGTCSGIKPANGTFCDDNNALTKNDHYTNYVCAGTLPKDGTSCDDGLSGTYNDVYTSGYCNGNWAPEVLVNNVVSVSLNQSKFITNFDLMAIDKDYDTINYGVDILPNNGGLLLNGTVVNKYTTITQDDINNHRLRYTPMTGYVGADSMSLLLVKYYDASGKKIVEGVTVSFNITNDNVAPVAVSTSLNVDSGTSVSIKPVNLNATDDKSTADNIVYTLSQYPSYGTLSNITFTQTDINNGTVLFTANGSYTGEDTIVFNVSDGTDSSTVTLPIIIKSGAPFVQTNNLLTVPLNITTALDSNILTVVDTDPITFNLNTLPQHGNVLYNGAVIDKNISFNQTDIDSGKISYSPSLGYVGTDIFVVKVSDGVHDTFANVSVNVTAN